MRSVSKSTPTEIIGAITLKAYDPMKGRKYDENIAYSHRSYPTGVGLYKLPQGPIE